MLRQAARSPKAVTTTYTQYKCKLCGGIISASGWAPHLGAHGIAIPTACEKRQVRVGNLTYTLTRTVVAQRTTLFGAYFGKAEI